MRTTREMYFFIGFLVILIVSLITAIVVITTTNKNKANTDSLPTNTQICMSEGCVRSAALISSSMDASVDACDDFYQYACGNWQKDHPVNDNDIFGWSHFARLTYNMRDSLTDLLIKTKEKDEAKYLKPLFTLFNGCNNIDARDKAGFGTLKKLIKDIGGWPLIQDSWDQSKYNLTNALVLLSQKFGSQYILGFTVQPNITNTGQTLIYIQHSFMTPNQIVGIYRHPEEKKIDTSYYDDSDDKFRKLAELLKGSSINVSKWNIETNKVKAFESKLKQIASPTNLKNLMTSITIKQLINQYKGIDWITLLKGIFINANVTIKDTDHVVVTDPNYFSKLSSVINSQSKETIANYISALVNKNLISFTTTNATKMMVPEEFKQLSKFCSSLVTKAFPNQIGRLYIDKLFNKESIKDMRSLVNDLKEAFNELLDENKWMDSDTKQNAKSKLEAISVNIATPNFTLNDNELQTFINDYKNIDSQDFLKSVLTIAEIDMNKQWKKLRTSSTKGLWPESSSAALVNAFYYPSTNAIYFPAAIAQFPFFQHNSSLVTNIGAIGAVIGHEITHAFDTTGSIFDKNGNYANWWTPSTRNTFISKTKCFVDQYNKFSFNGVKKTVNGTKTLGENIADNGGLREAFRALQKMKKRSQLNKLPGKMSTFTHEQIFFLSYANIWCSHKSPLGITSQIDTDEHSPEKARVLGTLSNFDEFSKAFNCKDGSKMNKNTDKCILW